MNVRAGLAVCVILVLAGSKDPASFGTAVDGGRVFRPGNPQQTFRTGTDAVVVDVSVRRGNTPVSGLTAADFEVRDNGIRQDVEMVESTGVPIDLSIVVDMSGSPQRPWIKPVAASKLVAEVNEEVSKLTKLLRPGDRVRLMAQDTYVQQVWPLQAASPAPRVTAIQGDGLSSLYDTLAMLLMQPVEFTRRHVIVGATRGTDSVSATKAATVREIAERSDAQLHLVMLEVDADSEATIPLFQCACMDLCRPTKRFWTPRVTRLFHASPTPFSKPCEPGSVLPDHSLLPDGLELKAGAETTGGGIYLGAMFAEPSLHSVFERAFANFRQSYVLRYIPKGVTRSGWHEITVTVPRDKSLKVLARRGYAIDDAPSGPAITPVPVAPRTLAEIARAYEAGAFTAVGIALRQAEDPAGLMTDFTEAGNPWPGVPMREAALAIELAEAGLHFSRSEVRDQGQTLVDRFAGLVRDPLEPQPIERLWYYAALTMLQGALRPGAVENIATKALVRFPREPRFVLAQAIAADLRTVAAVPRSRAAGTRSAIDAAMDAARLALEEAAAFPEVAAEARVRLAFLLIRRGAHGEALEQLKLIETSQLSDPAIRFLHHLFRGHALGALSRDDEAIAAYREALAIVPNAQSARVALMNALFRRGDREGAESLAEGVQKDEPSYTDPWWMYWQGQYRLYPQVINRLRETAK